MGHLYLALPNYAFDTQLALASRVIQHLRSRIAKADNGIRHFTPVRPRHPRMPARQAQRAGEGANRAGRACRHPEPCGDHTASPCGGSAPPTIYIRDSRDLPSIPSQHPAPTRPQTSQRAHQPMQPRTHTPRRACRRSPRSASLSVCHASRFILTQKPAIAAGAPCSTNAGDGGRQPGLSPAGDGGRQPGLSPAGDGGRQPGLHASPAHATVPQAAQRVCQLPPVSLLAEVVDTSLAVSRIVGPAQKVASCDVAVGVHRNPDDASCWICPRTVAIQRDIASRAIFPVSCIHERTGHLVSFQPLNGELRAHKPVDRELLALLS